MHRPDVLVRRRGLALVSLVSLTPLATLLLSACVVVPQTREVYDAKCKVLTKEVVLETAVVGQFVGCQDRECAAMLAALGIVTVATAVVSGSVAVVGNVVYWFERQGRCMAARP